ncbi:MAG TPA: histidine kinase [Puia sp.]|jgi:two-component system LytT family sensor kinase|nr:histidine kinase [Puia sp.]
MRIQRKYSPYIFIAILCLIGAYFRYTILRGFSWPTHVLLFFGQFTAVSAIWQLIRLVNKKLEKRFTIDEQPGTQILLQVMVTLMLLLPVFIFSYFILIPRLPLVFKDQDLLPVVTVIFIIVIIMMTFGYYTYDLFIKYKFSSQEQARLGLKAANLEKEKSMMRFHHLKNQVNPHFLFNTLTSLDGLIQTDPELASDFVRHLAKVYRYLLEHKENEVLSLETEVNFIRHYISLLQIRYKEAIEIKLDISGGGMEKGIVMVTLQMLIDNAIKHNSAQSAMPLKIWIWDEGGSLHIQNNKQLRKQIETSNSHGLKQLQELYSFLTDRPVEINDKAGSFEINLPLL